MTNLDAATAAARADLCRFLAACHYQPAPEFSEEKLFESMLAAATHIDPALEARTRRLGECFASEGIENLLVDYTRLFLGPSHILAKPYGSVWLTGEKTLMQDSTSAVSELYREAGFDLDDTFRELPDHIAAELEFLYLLIYRENEARLAEDAAGLEAVARARTRFLNEHLGQWVIPFTAAMGAGARSGFYRELAALTELFVGLERKRRLP
jgi:putative dimethyl sulfoxide reductase chaperone